MRHSELILTLHNLTKHKPTQQNIADILGCGIGTISARAFRDSNYSESELAKIGNYYNTNLLDNDFVNAVKLKSDSIEVVYYPDVFGSCGNGVFIPAETKEKIQVPIKAIDSYNSNKTYSVINAVGDSMKDYILDKDMLIVEQYNGEQIKDNRIYVFRYGDNLFVKRLVLNINQLVVISDNPDYDTIKIELPCDNLQIIGQVVGLMRKS